MAQDEIKTPTHEAADEGFGGKRRLGIGINVGISVLLAVGLVVLLNYIASLKHVRADVATFGSYGLSDRTRNILSGLKDEVRITTAYLSTDPDSARDRFIDRLTSYGDEMSLASKQVTVEHISREDEKAKLVHRIAETYGSESAEHKKVVGDYAELRKELDQTLQFGGGAGLEGVAAGEGWLMNFPAYGSLLTEFREDRNTLKTAAEEIDRAVGGTIPKYAEATSKMSASLKPIKDQLTKAQQGLAEIAKLAEQVKKPDSTLIKALKDSSAAVKAIPEPLLATLGVGAKEPPTDAKAALSAFAAEAGKVEESLRKLSARIDALAKANPAIETHQYWRIAMNMGMFQADVDMPQLLTMSGRDLRQNRQAVLDLVDRGDPKNMGKALDALRDRVLPQLGKNLMVVSDSLDRMAVMLGSVDPASARVLDQARTGTLFEKTIASMGKLLERIEKLPVLKLGQIADELRRDNVIVVESKGNKQARVLGFDDVWPVREQMSAGPGSSGESRPRTFNGDSAIGGAILALTSAKPFATVVFATFEVEPPQQMRQFMQPQQSSIPGEALAKLKDRLRAANFAVREWDLAKTDPPPPPEAGTESVYVFTPPAPPNPANPFSGGQNPSRTFGDAERKRVQDVLDQGGRAVFLCCWEWRPGGMFGGFSTPDYGYAKMLKDQWGVEVDNAHRIVEVMPDAKRPGRFSLSGEYFNYMGLNQFSEHPIGRAFKNTRMYAFDACPLARSAKVPDGVDVEAVLSVPNDEKYVAADVAEVIRWVNSLNNPESEQGSIERGDKGVPPPFPVVLAATRKKDGKESRILVTGAGKSLWDRYMGEPMQRVGTKGALYSDPPPSNNADFLVNGLHWLRGEEKWIAAGPVAAPAIAAIEPGKKQMLAALLCGGFPLLVLVVGGMMWWVRQR